MLPTSFQTVEWEEQRPEETIVRATFRMPTYLSKAYNLSLDSPVQYENKAKSVFLLMRRDAIIRDAAKANPDSTLDAIYRVHMENLLLAMDHGQANPPRDITLKGYPAMRGTFPGGYLGDSICYDLTLIQTEQEMYQILLWTKGDQRLQYLADLDTIVLSFNPLK
ncbi:hypothetical protein [Pontibacter sp. G13]|uniref:hypothetical protein n=1 Tax=Pontibacter sp. G13 TaxID=3074898 RepID=UPI00288B4E0E|nr:hypothetical protein [Pontibacter sp. G13]WNJ19846.1 hypothetical protein RJD25_05130 [Pontibacter sp. G13]